MSHKSTDVTRAQAIVLVLQATSVKVWAPALGACYVTITKKEAIRCLKKPASRCSETDMIRIREDVFGVLRIG